MTSLGSNLRPSVGRIAEDLEVASTDNLDAYEATGSAGIASERCDSCDRPLVISSYPTWFDSLNAGAIRVHHYTCECRY